MQYGGLQPFTTRKNIIHPAVQFLSMAREKPAHAVYQAGGIIPGTFFMILEPEGDPFPCVLD